MATAEPFILLDDARPTTDGGAGAGARLFEAPVAVFRALRPEEVEVTIAAAEAAQAEATRQAAEAEVARQAAEAEAARQAAQELVNRETQQKERAKRNKRQNATRK